MKYDKTTAFAAITLTPTIRGPRKPDGSNPAFAKHRGSWLDSPGAIFEIPWDGYVDGRLQVNSGASYGVKRVPSGPLHIFRIGLNVKVVASLQP